MASAEGDRKGRPYNNRFAGCAVPFDEAQGTALRRGSGYLSIGLRAVPYPSTGLRAPPFDGAHTVPVSFRERTCLFGAGDFGEDDAEQVEDEEG